jgi:ribosome-associated translation inhibitor RaiA
MQIEIGTDNHLDSSDELRTLVTASVTSGLARFERRLTRLIVHLADENGDKGGDADIRCTIEARPERHQPVAATHNAATVPAAVTGAVRKLARTLGRVRDRTTDHKHTPPTSELTA